MSNNTEDFVFDKLGDARLSIGDRFDYPDLIIEGEFVLEDVFRSFLISNAKGYEVKVRVRCKDGTVLIERIADDVKAA